MRITEKVLKTKWAKATPPWRELDEFVIFTAKDNSSFAMVQDFHFRASQESTVAGKG